MDAEMMIAIRRARIMSRTAWRGENVDVPTTTHPAVSNVRFISGYRPVTRDE